MTMTRVLGIALVAQVLLAVLTWWPSEPGSVGSLVALERDAIEEVEVASRPGEGETGKPVVLTRSGEGWVVRSAGDYPAQGPRVDELLDAIVGLRAGSAIATRSTSHDALSIGDEDYGRRLVVRGSGVEESWLLAPATSRSVYARRAGEDEVFRATGASEWAFRDQPSDYWDASYLSDDAEQFDVVAVQNGGVSLRFEKRDGAWTLSDLAEGERADPDAIASFVSKLATLRMREPVGREVLPEHGLATGARVDWTIPAENQSISGGWAVGADVESDAYVKAAGQPFVVRVSQTQVQPLRDATREQFLQAAEAESE